MSVRWTYIDPATVFNPFIGFQTVLIALIGGAATLWGPLLAAVVFSLLAETLRLQMPQVYMMSLGLLLILSVLYLPGGLASTARWRASALMERGTMGASRCVEARALTVRFGGLTAVDAVSAAFAPGELVGIIGPNGAGKTTFFNALSGVVAPTSGELFALGERLTGARAAPLRRARHRPHLPDAARLRRAERGGQRRLRPAASPAAGGRRPALLQRRGEHPRPARARRRRRPCRPRRSRRRSSACSRSAWRWRRGRGCCCSTRSPPA